ncbi:MAG: NADH-quinone oxidoreductase subunit I [Thermodesulfobacteriota bacterium]
MSGYFKEIIDGATSLAVGLGITFKHMVGPVVTVQYPHQSLKMKPRFRGHIELTPDPETGESICIVCGLCQKGCPSDCISVSGAKDEATKKKVLTEYTLDFTKCSLCGQCVENCKPGAIRFSMDYNLASQRREDFVFDLVKRLKERKP